MNHNNNNNNDDRPDQSGSKVDLFEVLKRRTKKTTEQVVREFIAEHGLSSQKDLARLLKTHNHSSHAVISVQFEELILTELDNNHNNKSKSNNNNSKNKNNNKKKLQQ